MKPTIWLERVLEDVHRRQELSPHKSVRVIIDDVQTCEEKALLVKDADDEDLDYQSMVLRLQPASFTVRDSRRDEILSPERAKFNDMLFGDDDDCPAIVVDDKDGDVNPVTAWRAIRRVLEKREALIY